MTTDGGSKGRENLRGRGKNLKEAGSGDCLANTYQVNLFDQETKQTIIIY